MGIELVFNDEAEFLSELAHCTADGETPPVVRLTISRRQASGGMPLVGYTAVATCVMSFGTLYGLCSLRVYCGEDMLAAGGAAKKAKETMDRLDDILQAKGFQVRAGILQPTDRQGRPG